MCSTSESSELLGELSRYFPLPALPFPLLARGCPRPCSVLEEADGMAAGDRVATELCLGKTTPAGFDRNSSGRGDDERRSDDEGEAAIIFWRTSRILSCKQSLVGNISECLA